MGRKDLHAPLFCAQLHGVTERKRKRAPRVPTDVTVGERMRFFRERSGITQGELGLILKKSPATICRYEANRIPIPTQLLSRFCDAMGISMAIFFGALPERARPLR